MTNSVYIGYTFLACGIYGMGFSGAGLLMAVPLLIAWRAVYPRSFFYVLRRPASSPQPEQPVGGS
jgi:hypothetical protein